MKNILKAIIYSGVLSVVVFAQPAFAVTFSTIKTNSALGTNSDSTLGAPGASVADFFAAQNAYEAKEADKKIPTISDYTPEKSNSDSSSSNSIGSIFGSDNTSDNSDSQANGNSENGSATNSDDESSWEDRGASEDSASAQAGSYGTIVGSTYGNSLQGSAFYARSGNSNNALNSGYFFIPLLMLLVVIYLVRRMFQRKTALEKYPRAPRYMAAAPYGYQPQYVNNFQDEIHDPARYPNQNYVVVNPGYNY
jgi:hypothetical protein